MHKGEGVNVMDDVTISVFTMEAYDPVVALWQACEGIGLSEADSRPNIAAYLARNPGMSFVAWAGGRLVGAVLCGHDGRRGYLHHMAVHPDCRRRGVGQALAHHCLAALQAAGVQKCHLFIFQANENGRSFWQSTGWEWRQDILIMSHKISGASDDSCPC